VAILGLGGGGGLPGGAGGAGGAFAGVGGFGAAPPLPGIEGGLAKDGGLAAAELPAGLSLGMPPANRPPICGGPALPTEAIVEALCPAPERPLAPPPPPLGGSTIGALRSFVSAFLSFLPA